MNALLFPVFDFVAKNRWVQIVLLCVTGLIVVRIWLWVHDDKVKKLAKAKAVQETRNTLDKIEDKSDARIEQADAIRANNPVSPSDNGMSEQPLPDYHYRN